MRMTRLVVPILALVFATPAIADDAPRPSAPDSPAAPFANDGDLQSHIREFLHKADRNGDGELDPAERDAARRVLEQHSRQARKERADKNDNGHLEPQEKAAFHKMLEQKQASKDRADRNDDGRVGPKERDAAEKIHQHKQHEHRQGLADRNHDGKVGPQERKAAHDKLQKLDRNKTLPSKHQGAKNSGKPTPAEMKAALAKQVAKQPHGPDGHHGDQKPRGSHPPQGGPHSQQNGPRQSHKAGPVAHGHAPAGHR